MKNLRSKYQVISLNKRQECDSELIVNQGFNPSKGLIQRND